jgi:hypothetical protein
MEDVTRPVFEPSRAGVAAGLPEHAARELQAK